MRMPLLRCQLSFIDVYSNHLNTVHLKSEHSNFQTVFCPVFKWSEHVIRRTIWIPDILDENTDLFCLVFTPNLKFGPFSNLTLDHLNTRPVRHSDGYCTFIYTYIEGKVVIGLVMKWVFTKNNFKGVTGNILGFSRGSMILKTSKKVLKPL